MIEQLEAVDGIFSELMHERAKQISKGYDAAHDDDDAKGNHARAAAYYAIAGYAQRHLALRDASDVEFYADAVSSGYPWSKDTKAIESRPRANLIKAAALLIAEIERIDREESGND